MKSIVVAVFCLAAGIASAAEIKVLSGGAVEPGLEAFAHQVKHELGHELKIQYNTAPQIAKRLASGDVYDILISPPGVIDAAIKEGKVVAEIREDASTIALGHHDVEKDQVGHAMTHRIHREERVVFDKGLIADSVQCLGEQGRHGNVVVDD